MNEPQPATCPKCSSPRAPGALECPSCGVIYARFQPRRERPQPRPVAPVTGAAPVASSVAAAAPASPAGYVPARRVENALSLLAQALESGLSLTSYLHGPGANCLPPGHQQRLLAELEAGGSLAGALGALDLLDPGSLALLGAGERHGRLPETLRQVSERLAERRKDRNRLLLALAYPSVLFVGGALVLPLPALFSVGPGAYWAQAAPLLLGIGAIAGFALYVLPRLKPSSPVRRGLRSLGAAVPIASSVVWSGAVASFADVLGACLRAGLPAPESLALAARAGAHPRFEQGLPTLLSRLQAGATLADAVAAIPGLDPMLLTQIGAAERSGTLDKILPQVATEWRRRARTAAIILVGVIGAIALAGVVLMLAIKVIAGWQDILGGRAGDLDRVLGQ